MEFNKTSTKTFSTTKALKGGVLAAAMVAATLFAGFAAADTAADSQSVAVLAGPDCTPYHGSC